MVLFGLINCEDYILRTIVKSSYAKNGLTVLFMYLITGIIRFHLSVLLCWLFTITNTDMYFALIINLIIPIIINVFLTLLSDTLYQYVSIHRYNYEKLVDYIITNYSRENMIKWKRILLVGIFIYIIIVITLIKIDNKFLLISTIQTAITFIICDILENRNYMYNKINLFINKPKVNRLHDDFSIIHDYENKVDTNPPLIKKRIRSYSLTNKRISSSPLINNRTPNSPIIFEERTPNSPIISEINKDRISPIISEINKDRISPIISEIDKDRISPIISEIDKGRISPPIPEKPPTPPRLIK